MHDDSPEFRSIRHVFVYGTLLPGDVRFPMMEPFIVDDGWPDEIRGELFDTGHDFPAAIIGRSIRPDATVVGRTFALLEGAARRALEVLDEVEGVVDGEYERVAVTTATSTRAWMYTYGGGLTLTPIVSGDWLSHRPPERALPLTPD